MENLAKSGRYQGCSFYPTSSRPAGGILGWEFLPGLALWDLCGPTIKRGRQNSTLSLPFQLQILGNLGYPFVINPFSLKAAIFYLFAVLCVLRTWFSILPAWDMQVVYSCVCRQLSCQVGGSKIWPKRNVGCTPCAAKVLLTVASFQGNSVFLLPTIGSDSESWEDSIFCTLVGGGWGGRRGHLFCSWGHSIPSGMFIVSPSWNLTR